MSARKVVAAVFLVPVVLLLLSYMFLVSLPTGIDSAEQEAAADLARVAERTAPRAATAPKAAPTVSPVPGAFVPPDDFAGACNLALRGFEPGGPPTNTHLNFLRVKDGGQHLGWVRGNWRAWRRLPHGARADRWGELLESDPNPPALLKRAAGGEGLFDPPTAEWLDRAELTIYGSTWELPSFQQNFPAASSSGGMLPLATASQVLVLTSAARGDAERTADYLPRCVELSQRLPIDQFGMQWMQNDQTLGAVLLQVSALVELPEPVWQEVAEQLEAGRLAPEDYEAFRKAFALRQAEVLKSRVTKLIRSQSTIHFFWRGRVQNGLVHAMAPVVRNRADALATALLTGGDVSAAEAQLRAAGRAADIQEDPTSYFQHLAPLSSLPPLVNELYPDLFLPAGSDLNASSDMARACVALIRYRLRHGRDPERFADLMPELLPADFPSTTHAAWLVVRSPHAGIGVARAIPTEPFGGVPIGIVPGAPDEDVRERSEEYWPRLYPPGAPLTPSTEQAIREGPEYWEGEVAVRLEGEKAAQLRRHFAGT